LRRRTTQTAPVRRSIDYCAGGSVRCQPRRLVRAWAVSVQCRRRSVASWDRLRGLRGRTCLPSVRRHLEGRRTIRHSRG
jgi:hypothetical protein